MCKAVYVKFPDAQVKGHNVWVNSSSIICVVPNVGEGERSTLMISSNLDSGIEVAMSAEDAVDHLEQTINTAMSSGYYLSTEEGMYNANKT
tara:strand:+ start:205 stop:477 length:273 start_codon:yes stop_codon:yes gene_type:complete